MTNKQLAVSLREMKALLIKSGENNLYRLRAYDRAANQLELLGRELAEVYGEGGPLAVEKYLADVKNLGDKSCAKINEFLQTGTCKELETLRSSTGTVVQKSEIKDEVVRRPWAEADQVVQLVLPVVQKHFKTTATVCGSYRRKKPMVKDIDIVVTFDGKDAEPNFNQVISTLGVHISGIIKKGPAQTSFWYGGFQIDIWVIPPESYGSAILFATGSADFNIQMRGWLKGRGYKLNRYGLYDAASGKWLAGNTEQQIFDALGINYVRPEDRINFQR